MSSRTGRIAAVLATAVALSLADISIAHAAPADQQPTGLPITHSVPRVPITIDGKPAAPGTVTRYNGRPLYSAALPDGGPDGSLAIFTDPADFERFVSARGGPAHALAKPPQATRARAALAPSATGYAATDPNLSYLYEHANFQGARLSLASGYGFADLTKIPMNCDVWLFCRSWNDKASSLVASRYGQTVYEHINYQGSVLWTPGGQSRSYLDPLGWNDRASSFISW